MSQACSIPSRASSGRVRTTLDSKRIVCEGAHLDVDFGADFEAFTKEIDVLHEAGELPHVAQLLELRRDEGCRLVVGLHLLNGPLPSRHGGW